MHLQKIAARPLSQRFAPNRPGGQVREELEVPQVPEEAAVPEEPEVPALVRVE